MINKMEGKSFYFYSKKYILIVFVLYASCIKCAFSDFISIKVGANNGLKFSSNKSDAIAWGTFQNEINKTGWSYLEIATTEASDDVTQAYAAGLVEGRLTSPLLRDYIYNTGDGRCSDSSTSDFCTKLKAYLNVNLQWMYSQIVKAGGNDTYWHQVSLFLAQVNGIRDGYMKAPKEPTYILEDPLDIFLQIQIEGDLEDLSEALSGHYAAKRVLGSGSCSALIKLLPGNQDLYVAHDTWSGYQGMMRLLKKITLNVHVDGQADSPLIPGSVMSFPSNPGSVTSGDDFYVIQTGLVTLETTIGNSNPDLWMFVTPTNSVLEGIRSMIANRLATTGKQWSDLFLRFNSGTYNNQWMVVDYKQFEPKHPIKQDTLWVIEQIPKFTHASDRSEVLTNQYYWPSYNIPYYPDIFQQSGQSAAQQKYGDWFSYSKSPRALIFKRDHEKITDIPSMIKLMRYNDFTHDPLSACNCTPPYSGENTISARSDLNPANGTYPFGALGHRNHGGIDMKVTNSAMSQSLQFISQLGPAFGDVPAFRWSTSDYRDLKHRGMPDLYEFEPILHAWTTEDTTLRYKAL